MGLLSSWALRALLVTSRDSAPPFVRSTVLEELPTGLNHASEDRSARMSRNPTRGGSHHRGPGAVFTTRSNESQRLNLHLTLLFTSCKRLLLILISIQQQQILRLTLSRSTQNSAQVFQPEPAAVPSISERPPAATSSTASTYTYRLFGF
jgi:hypothetical protein